MKYRVVLIFLLSLCIVTLDRIILKGISVKEQEILNNEFGYYREMKLTAGKKQSMREYAREFSWGYLSNNQKKYKFFFQHPTVDKKLTTLYKKRLETMLEEITYFPISKEFQKEVTYENSWGHNRSYGGDRTHEGTDLMYQKNKAGIVPVVSVCDGTVENIGWLTLGGYRVGIRSKNGNYYYYAHLHSYNPNLSINTQVSAGTFLGMMGNTGYGSEGTTGKFPVHLHFGIYVRKKSGLEESVNSYWVLKWIEGIEEK